ncbi:MAG TPA: hypothetical protein VNO43_10095 [Candidatus Eisenbacteria bacterium]|nr:hypothetical protein [Candidatus Eisenbacteria bacterium]
MRPTIGEVKCPFHERPRKAELRQDRNGKLYFYCPHGCGPVNVHGRTFQEWILSKAHIFNPDEVTA